MLFTLGELKARIGGFLYSEVQWNRRGMSIIDDSAGIRGFQVDSRKVGPGDLFFPLKGERTDGHRFLTQVVSRGCRSLLVSQTYYRSNADSIRRLVDENSIVVFPVGDVLGALHLLSRLLLTRYSLTKIGITGSNGKTTTKELVSSILSVDSPTFMTPGNYNSVIGLPLSVPLVEPRHRYGVFEMAMSEKGEMKRLSDLVFPSIGILTGIGTAHIGNIGSQMGIASEKFELFRNFLPDSIAILPEDDPFVRKLEGKVRGKKYFFGIHSTPGFEGVAQEGPGSQIFRWKGRDIRLALPGAHNLKNALAAISLSGVLGISDESVQQGLEGYKPIFGRGQIKEGSVTLISDCYNANPDSMAASIQSFLINGSSSARRILFLGDMKELGRFSVKEHEDLGRIILEHKPHGVMLYGEEIEVTYRFLASRAGFPVYWSREWDEVVQLSRELITCGDWVLLKGSRSMELERIEKVLIGETSEVREC